LVSPEKGNIDILDSLFLGEGNSRPFTLASSPHPNPPHPGRGEYFPPSCYVVENLL